MMLGDTIRYPLTGIGRYAMSLASQLTHQGVALSVWQGGQLHEGLPTGADVSPRGTVGRAWVLSTLSRFPLFLDLMHRLLQTVEANRVAKACSGWVMHGPNYHVPPVAGAARVVTIHDLSVFCWAQCHAPDRVLRMQRVIRQSIRYAHRIITDAEFNRQELMAQFNLPPERVVAIPLACDARFCPEAMQQTPVGGLASKAYGLFVGTIEPRKNLDTLLSAWASLPESLRHQCPLVVAGGSGWRSEATHARLKQAETEGWLRYLGFVPDEQLPTLYAHARLFCFPSWYEGFGLPVLEAMACGVPVVCSSSSCLPEVGGAAVRYAPPADVLAWAAAIHEVLTDADEEARLSAAGLQQARQFSWARTADMTLSVYREAQQVFAQEQTA